MYQSPLNQKSRGVPQAVLITKSVDETIDTDTIMGSDAELQFVPGINSVHVIELTLMVISPAAADIKVGWSVPSGATVQWGASSEVFGPLLTAGTPELPTDGTNQLIMVYAVVRMGSTAGVVAFQWAQSTSNGGDTKVLKNSTLKAWKVLDN